MREVWSLAGYDVQRLLGVGATGEVWRARCLATGQTVALKRLREHADLDALRRVASLLQALDTPYVVRLQEVLASGTDTVLVLDHADGGSLAALLARRGALAPGEVVTVAVPVAQALAAAHACGLVHGAVTASNVLFTADGMPLLSDLGVARTEAGADAAADVRALAALCQRMLSGAPQHDRVAAAVEAALGDDPAARPDAATFASMLRRAHAAAPVRLGGSTSTVAPPPAGRARHARRSAARRRRVPLGLLLGLGMAALLVAGGMVGWHSGRAGASPVPALPTAGTTPAAGGWEQVLDGLDATRAQAFADGDLTALAETYAPGSPGLASDTALLQALVDRRQTAYGVRHEVRRVEVLEQAPEHARLQVVDVLPAYDVLDAEGEVVSHRPGRGERSFVVELARTGGGWRLVEVRPLED